MADPKVVVVDGSNLATEGRTTPSLRQLDEAVQAYAAEDPDAEIVVVVDASFEHRIDPAERPQLTEAELHGEVVSPPAGAIGRGDAFVLRIAERTGARVLSNDSFQEFHAEHPWLFDEGRLVGGKPVPGVGWIFTPRIPVRGPRSRQATGKAKRSGAETLSPPVKAAELARAAKKVAARRVPLLPDGSAPRVGDVWPGAGTNGNGQEPPAAAGTGPAGTSLAQGPSTAGDAAAAQDADQKAKGKQSKKRKPALETAAKAPAKRAGAKSAPAKKAPARKAAASEAVAADAAAEQVVAKKAPAKKAPAKKAVAKKAAETKAAAGAEEAPASRTRAKRAAKKVPAETAATETAAETATAETAATEMAPAEKTPEKKTPAKKATKRAAVERGISSSTLGRLGVSTDVANAEVRPLARPGERASPDVPGRRRARQDPELLDAIDLAVAEALSPQPLAAELERPVADRPRKSKGDAKGDGKGAKRRRRRTAEPPPAVNEPLAFITFVASFPLHSDVEGEVVSFTSHGAMVDVELPGGGLLHCYIPLTAMGDPPPTKARQVLARGERRSFVLVGLDPPRRVAELALPGVPAAAGAAGAAGATG